MAVTALFLALTFNSLGQVTNIYSQNFGAVTTMPAGWWSLPVNAWTISLTNPSTTPTFSGNSNAAIGNNNALRTINFSNNLSTVGYTSITVLWAARRTSNNLLTFEWSPDNITWYTQAITNVPNNSVWAYINGGTRVSLPAAAAGASNLSFRWTYNSGGTIGAYRFDDFTVEGCKLPLAPASITGSFSPCQGTSQVYSVPLVAGNTYTWSFPAGWTQTAGGNTNSVTVTVGSSSGNISVFATNVCGAGPATTFPVNVLTPPAQPGPITGLVAPCRGSSQTYSVPLVAGVLYTWTFPAGWTQTGGGTTNSVTVNVGAAAVAGNITVTPSNACGSGTPRLLAVVPASGVPLQPSAITGNSLPCSGVAQTYSVTSVANVTYTWVFPAGWTILSGQGTNSVSVMPGINGTITVTPSNGCGNGLARTLAVQVLSIPLQPGAITGNISPCTGTSQVYTVPSLAGLTYTWTVPADWIITAGNGTASITVTVGASAGSIQVVPSNVCGSGPAQSLIVSVLSAAAQPSPIIGNTLVCRTSVQVYSVTNTPGITYTWTLPAGWILVSGQGTNTITATAGLSSGNITVTPSNGCGNGPAQSLAVTVQTAAPAPPALITGNSFPCQGSVLTYSVVAVAGVTYTWAVPAGWSILSGQGTATVSVQVGATAGNISVIASNTCGTATPRTLPVTPQAAAPAQTSPISGMAAVCRGATLIYSVTNTPNVTYTWSVPADWTIVSGQGTNAIQVSVGTLSGVISVVPSNACGSAPAQTLNVTVSSGIPATAGPVSGLSPVCQGTTQVYTVPATPGITYTWSTPSTWTLVSGQGTNSVTYTIGSTSATLSVQPSNACGNGLPALFPVTVNPLPPSPGVITGPTELCENERATYLISGIPGITYTWSFPAGWSIVGGQGTSVIDVTTGNLSGMVTVTPSNSCGNGTPSQLNVTINRAPDAYTGPDAVICEGASIQLGGPAVGGNTYSWTSLPAGFSSSLSNPVVTPAVTTTYILTETNSATGCSRTDSVTVSTNQVISITVNPSSLTQTICSGSSTNILLTSNLAGTVFNWTATLTSGSGTVFTPSGTGASIAQLITNTSAAPAVITYSVTAIAAPCTNSSTTITVTVNPVPLAANQSKSVCSDIPSALTLNASTNGVPASTYSITAINANGLTASAGNPITGNGFSNTVIADDAWTNTTAAPVNVIYTIQPVSAAGCPGTAFQVTLTVNPKPVLTNPLTASICSGASTGIALTSNIAATYSWTIGTITGGITGATASSGATIAQTLVNPSNTTAGTVQYIVTPLSVAGSCTGSPQTITVTINPKPAVTIPATAQVCSGAPLSIALTSSIPSTFSWTVGTITGGITGAVAGSGATLNQVLTNPSNSVAGTVQFIISTTSVGTSCPGLPFTLTVTVNPNPSVTAASSVASVCPGVAFNLTSTSTAGGSPTILNENFNAATNSWTKTNTSTGGTPALADWLLHNDGYNNTFTTFHSNDNSQFYLSDSRTQAGSITNTTLISPTLSTVGYSAASLSFWHYLNNNGTTGEYARVEASLDNGATWAVTLLNYTTDQGGAASFVNAVVALPASCLNVANLKIRFAYYCGGVGRYWAIDNVSLTGTPSAVPVITWSSNPTGFTSNVANPTGVTQAATTQYSVNYQNPLTSCQGSASVTVTALPMPQASVTAEYCSVPGKIRLTAHGGGTYLWSTGETTQVILVDIAGIYSVEVTNASGCTNTAFFSVANELVVNGSFNAGNTGFTTGYLYSPAANGLYPEGTYSVYHDAQFTHGNFWGYDHTTGSGTGNDNFLIVNGATVVPQPIVWSETVTVMPNTDYYFSAWSISLNNVSPFAELRFSVNGTQVGTTAFLTSGQNVVNNPWLVKDRFYGMWNSGAATTAVIQILDLSTIPNGNDFGVDDISFGTLAQIPFTLDPTAQPTTLCTGQTLELYANISGGRPPITYSWTGPNGFVSNLQNPTIPNIQTNGSGKYYLTVTDGYGCAPVKDSVMVTVLGVLDATMSGTGSLCQYSPYSTITFTGTGGIDPYTFTYTVNGGAPQTVSSVSGGTATVLVPTNVSGTFVYNLVSVASSNGCSYPVGDQLTITVHSLPTCFIAGSNPICPESSGNIFSGMGGMSSYAWSITGNGSASGPVNTQNLNVTAGSGCGSLLSLELITTDTFGCNAICTEDIQVDDVTAPAVSCPASVNVQADPGKPYATLSLPPPVFSDNCSSGGGLTVSWVMNNATTGTGSGTVPVPFQFNTGTTQVIYVVEDACGNTASCSFNVAVTPNDLPDITCPGDILTNTQVNVCNASLDPGMPVINAGVGVTLSWTMTGATTGSGTGAITPNPYTFNKGVTLITWIASNLSGTDTCQQTITVVDNQPPSFSTPGPFTFCVEPIFTADYYDPTMDIQPVRPDYYLMTAGSTVLDLNPVTFFDNCGLACSVEIRWWISFNDGSRLPALPTPYLTGQPSAYGSDILFPGDTTANKIHTITYQIVDCGGIPSLPVTVNITITPRPDVIKQ
jgi:hypothetical protein